MALSGWKVTAKRARGFLKTVMRSKMAALGTIILIITTIVAVAAPLVTPYPPLGQQVSGTFSPPEWYRHFAEGSRLSQNLVVEDDPQFAKEATVSAWTLQGGQEFSATWAGSSSVSGSGSVKLAFNREASPPGDYTVTFRKTFPYPYNGPPFKFAASIAVNTPTASPQEPVRVSLFIERTIDGRRWFLTDNTSWPIGTFPLVTPNAWYSPIEVDSTGFKLKEVLKVSDIDPALLIFASSDQYSYGAVVTFTSAAASNQPLEVFLDNMRLDLLGTSWGLLGTEANGYDVLSQIVYGARVSLLVGLLAAAISIVVGLVVGLAAGYLGSLVDETLMRFTDMLLVIPTLPLLIVLIAVLGDRIGASRLLVLILVIGFLGWQGFARVVRSQVLTLKERPFVEAAKAAGANSVHVVYRHIVPNIVGLIYVSLALGVPAAIISEAALSFLGLGDTTVMSWGRMLNEVLQNQAQRMWWWVIPPGFAIATVSLSFVLIGYSLDEIFNPKLRQRR